MLDTPGLCYSTCVMLSWNWRHIDQDNISFDRIFNYFFVQTTSFVHFSSNIRRFYIVSFCYLENCSTWGEVSLTIAPCSRIWIRNICYFWSNWIRHLGFWLEDWNEARFNFKVTFRGWRFVQSPLASRRELKPASVVWPIKIRKIIIDLNFPYKF